MLLDGKSLSDKIKEDLTRKIKSYLVKPCLAVIQIGDQVTIKKYYQDDTGITLIACNPSINDVHYTLKEANDLPVKVIGKVIFVKNYF